MGRPDMTSTVDSLTLEVLLCSDYRSEGWFSICEVHVYLAGTFCCAEAIFCPCPY